MTRLASNLARSRAWRKFRRNRLALAALAVVGLYVLVGLYVALGDFAPGSIGISIKEVDQPIAPTSLPGLFSTPTPERRADTARLYLDEFRKALRSGEEGLRELRYGARRPADKSLDDFRDILQRGRAVYDELSDAPDLNAAPHLLPKIEELERTVDELFAPLGGFAAFNHQLKLSLGTDRQGRSIFTRGVYSIKVALQVGIVVALVSVLVGTLLGAMAAFYGGWVDHAVVWLYSTLSSMPELVLLAVLVYAFSGTQFDKADSSWLPLVPLYLAMCMEFWIGPCRVVRGEVMKIKELEYVQAVRAIGFSRFYILLRHVIPNTMHLMFINLSLLFIAAIKYEVVLSFLGLGVKAGTSWGKMIQESTSEVINGFFWQIGAATVLLFILVLAFNIVSDALQDAFDPKHVD